MGSPSTDRRFGLNTGVAIKAPCLCATTAAITLNGLQTVDGVVLVADDRVLVKDQSDTTTNGPYIAGTGDWVRDADANDNRDLVGGTFIFVTSGTTNGDSSWKVVGSGAITVGTSAITFTASGTSANGDALNITYLPAGANAVSNNVRGKLRERVSIFDFMTAAQIADVQAGTLGEDVTTPFQNAATYAAANGRKLTWPGGDYLITDGVSTVTNYEPWFWQGETSLSESIGGVKSTNIHFTPSATSKYLFTFAHRGKLEIEDMTITGVDPVDGGELKLFRFTGSACVHRIKNVGFEGDHHWSIYYDTGSYFQNGSLTDVQFRTCGTIGSVGTALKGTLLVLDNVNHEGSTPANTVKTVMDLRGIRDIEGTNLLLEGSVPSADDWRALKLDNGATALETGEMSNINGFWVEFAGNALQYSIDVSGVRLRISEATGLYSASIEMKFDLGAQVIVENSSVLGTALDPDTDIAVFTDIFSHLTFRDCSLRTMDGLLNKQISYDNCTYRRNNTAGDAPFSVQSTYADNEILWEWDGGLVRHNKIVTWPAVSSSKHLRTIKTDATHGRLININKNAGVFPQWSTNVICPATWAGLTIRMQIYADFQAFTGGTFHTLIVFNAVAGNFYAVESAGGFQWYSLSVQVPVGGGTVSFANNTDHDSTITDIEIAAIRVSLGNYFSRYVSYKHPDQVVSYDSAAPTTGTWAVGDRVYDTAPAAGGNIGWVCTTAGTPGTWVPFGTTFGATTFTSADATPTVLGGSSFLSNATGVTITQFDNGVAGQRISIISKGATVYDTSTATRLVGSTVDITTASGDITTWVCEVGGTSSSVWRLEGFVDVSVDNSAGA